MDLIAGIDNGTQSTKVVLYDYNKKEIVAKASAPHDLITGGDGTREQEASWWIKALKSCFEALDPELKQQIRAIGVSGQQHGFVPVSTEGTVLNNVKLWCDTATADQADAIMQDFGGAKKMVEQVGNPVAVGYTASKIRWFKENKPELYQKMKYIMLPHDYLNFYLTGEAYTEYGDASGTGFLNIDSRSWNEEVLKAIDPDGDLKSKVLPLKEAHEVGGRVTAKAAAEFGIPQGVPVSTGGGDNMMSAIGAGVVSEGKLTVSMGTSGTLFGYSSKPIIDEQNRLAAFCSSSGGWLPLLCTMNCTVATELYRELFEMGVGEFDGLAAKSPAGSNGLVTIPFFNGERTPALPKGKGCLVGMTADNVKKENIARSAMESALYGIKMGLDAFVEKGFAPSEVFLVGGGSNSPLWRQIAADILGLPVRLTATGETAAYGSALQALWMLKYDEVKTLDGIIEQYGMTADSAPIYPDKSNEDSYRKGYGLYKSYVEALTPLYR